MDLGEFRLARTLQHQAQSERKIDVIRQLLIQEPGFNSYHLFRSIAFGKDFITADDLSVFLAENNFVITKPDAQALVSRYSKHTTVTYQDFFTNLELPDIALAEQHRALISSPRSAAAVSHKVLLAHKMKTEVETNRNSAVLKELLNEEVGANFYAAFRSADVKRCGFLTVVDMARIMNKFSITLTEAELDCLVRKYDTNRDGRISYLEFLTQLMPEGRVDSLRTPYSSPDRLAASPFRSSPSRGTSTPLLSPSRRKGARQQLSFAEEDEEDEYEAALNKSMARASLNESRAAAASLRASILADARSPLRPEQRIAELERSLAIERSLTTHYSSPSSRALALERSLAVERSLTSPDRCIMQGCSLPKYGRHYCSMHANPSPSRQREPLPVRSSPAQGSPARLSRSMASPNRSAILGSTLNESIAETKNAHETTFESMRQRLALHPSFTLLNAFKHLDQQGNGFITIGEVRRCMTDAGYFCTPEELECCIRLFDTNGDGRVSYAEFISKMMPTEAVYSELVSSPSAGGIRAERRLSIPAQLDLAKALKERMEAELQVEDMNRTQMYAWNN